MIDIGGFGLFAIVIMEYNIHRIAQYIAFDFNHIPIVVVRVSTGSFSRALQPLDIITISEYFIPAFAVIKVNCYCCRILVITVVIGIIAEQTASGHGSD